MQKLLNVSVSVTEEMVIKSSGGSNNKKIAKYLPDVLSFGANLLEIKGLYDVFPVAIVEEESVLLENGQFFNSEHLCKLLNGAEEVIVMCCTIGHALESKVKELNEKGDIIHSFLLDMYGAAAVATALQNLYQEISENYKGYGVTINMQPGQLDWNISEQQIIFKLISPGAIGVSLSDSYMMSPLKSVTSVFGVGDPDKVQKGGFACEVCPRREKCTFRQK
ncbi:MAG: hypothetical protein PHV03_09245 [Desulfitobacteriaceae bacterium]|nr:hypothetical protein [Desulfitobacteriaceae bacterium]